MILLSRGGVVENKVELSVLTEKGMFFRTNLASGKSPPLSMGVKSMLAVGQISNVFPDFAYASNNSSLILFSAKERERSWCGSYRKVPWPTRSQEYLSRFVNASRWSIDYQSRQFSPAWTETMWGERLRLIRPALCSDKSAK